MSEIRLLPCPFCGTGKLKVESKSSLYGHFAGLGRVENHTFSVRCNACHARGGSAGGKVSGSLHTNVEMPKWLTTDEVLKERAVEAWNRRSNRDLQGSGWNI